MFKLFCSDAKRVLKDRLFLISSIIGAVLAVTTPLLYALIFKTDNVMIDDLFAGLITGKMQYFSSFSLMNNFGLIAPLLLMIVLLKDFSQGTVRNKIIHGYSRTKIFSSLFLTTFVFFGGSMLVYALINLAVACPIFGYQYGGFDAEALSHFLLSTGLELLVLFFASAVISFFSVFSKNAGSAIVLYLATSFLFSMVSGILAIAIEFLALDSRQEKLVKTLETLQRLNVFSYTNAIGMTTYETADLLWYILTPLVFSALLLFFSALHFSKKDLK